MSSPVSRGPLVSRVRLRPWWQPGTATASQDGDVVRYSRADPPPPPSQPSRVAAGRSEGGRARGGASAAALSAGGGCAGVDHRVDRGPGPAHDRRPAGAHAHARTRVLTHTHAHTHAHTSHTHTAHAGTRTHKDAQLHPPGGRSGCACWIRRCRQSAAARPARQPACRQPVAAAAGPAAAAETWPASCTTS